MAYSLNPKGSYEEELINPYKPVATTRVASTQAVPPAQTKSGLRIQRRADGGDDFYRGNQKTTIEEFAKGTGNRVEDVRGYLASKGNKDEQRILTKQYYETKDPEVSSFNRLDVNQQRGRIAELEKAAGRKNFNIAEDMRNAKWAQEQLGKINQFGTKREGNLLTFGQDLVGGLVKTAARPVDLIADTFQAEGRTNQLRNLAREGKISIDDFNQGIQEIYQNNIQDKIVIDDKGMAQKQRLNPLEFIGQAAATGADLGTTFSPYGAGYKVAAGQTLKAAAPQIAKGLAKEGTAYTVAATGNDLLQGREVTPASILNNALLSYGGAAVGAGAALATPALKKGAQNALETTKELNPQYRASNSAEVLELDNFVNNLNQNAERLRAQGLSENSAPLIQNRRAVEQALQERSNVFNRELNTAQRELQGGFARIPGKAPEPEFSSMLQDAGMTPAQPKLPQPAGSIDAAIDTPLKQSRFTQNTVQGSPEVSDQLRSQVKSAEPTYQTVTDAGRIAASEEYLKTSGVKKATTDVRERLSAKNIDDQTVSDAIAVAKALDQKGNPTSLLEASAIYEELGEKLSKAGQTVQAASLLSNRTPQGLQYGALRALKKAGVEITDQMRKDIARLTDDVRKTAPGSYEDGLARFQISEYVAKNTPSSNISKATQLWKAGLLTSPRTTAGNLLGNLGETVFKKGYVDPLATLVDTVFSLFTKKVSRSLTYRGIGSGTKEGLGKAVSYFKTGYDPRNPAQKFDVRQIHYSDTPLGKAAETYTQTVFKLMGVADQPFYYANLRNSLYDQAITAATNANLKGKKAREFIKKFVTEPDQKAMQLADAEARYSVFQNETQLGQTASRLKNMEGIPGDIAEFLIPFSGVPSSVATRMVERTPIGTAIEIVRQLTPGFSAAKKQGLKGREALKYAAEVNAKNFDQRAMTQAIANGSAAIPLVGAGYALANSGLMTLGYPSDKAERDLWEAEGKQPYSIRVGDQWLSLNYLQPAGNLMAAGAEYAGKLLQGESQQEAWNTAVAGAFKALTEQSFLQGVSGAISAVNDPARFGQRFAESTAGSLVPNFIRTGARAFDPVKREVDSLGDAVAAGIPGLRQNLDEKTNILGEPVSRNSSTLNEIFNPFRPSDVQNQDNPVVQELRRLQDAKNGITPSQATKSSLEGLDDAQLREVNEKVSTQISGEYDRVMTDPRYEMLTDGDKKRILERVNDTVFPAVKSEYKDDIDLTKRSRLYKDGTEVDYFANFEKSTTDGNDIKSKLNTDTPSYKFLLETSNIAEEDKDAWSQSEVDPKYSSLVDNINSKLPENMPKVPMTNGVAELYADFEKRKADEGWSQLQTQKESRDLLNKAYKSSYTTDEKFLASLSDTELLNALDSGQVTPEQLQRIATIDETLFSMGDTPSLGNKVREALGYGKLSRASGGRSGGGGRGKSTFKVNLYESVDPTSIGKRLRKLVQEATL